MRYLVVITVLLGIGYSQCNEDNWEDYYNSEGHNMAGCYLPNSNLQGAWLMGANLEGANLEGACLEWAVGFTQTNYYGTPILEGCASGDGDCSFE